jgi:non-heme chloroperoxidase
MTATTTQRNDSAEERATQLRFSDVRLSTGVRLRYAEQGSATAQPVIFLHGYTDSWFSFSQVFPYFDASYRLFALDQRGHGDSEQPHAAYAIDEFATDVISFMDALGLTRAVLVGHSMGSFVAREAALQSPPRIEKLVLIGSATSARNEGVLELERTVGALEDPVPEEFAREFQESTIYQPLATDFMERVVAESLKLPARVWRAVLKGLLEVDTSSLDRIYTPALVLWGDRDAIFSRAEQDALAGILRHASLKVYAETGHALHWEQPEQFVKDLKEFIRS